MKYKDGAVEKKTMITVTNEQGKSNEIEKIQRYTEADIANGIANCDRLLATGLSEDNASAVQKEKEWWIECQKLLPVVEEPIIEEESTGREG